MSDPFRFNSEAKYQPRAQGTPAASAPTLTKSRVQVQVAQGKWFEVQYPDVFENYRLPQVSSDEVIQAWNSSPMQFWQNQLNFAIWCATAGCGVSLDDHLTAADPLLQSLYRFHVYYQIRRILTEIRAPLPQDQAWHAMNNPYDRRGYEMVCNEFGVSPHADWRLKGPNHGLGNVYIYWTHNGYHPVRREYDSAKMSFTEETTNEVLHIEYILQDSGASWTTFILDKSKGFTRPGVERLNDSIRTYAWAILGAQAQTRTGILGSGTAFDAQKQFLANLEDAISSPVDLPSAISRYQDVLQYARSEVNYSFGTGLYMAPGDMLLRVGRIAGYNNLIVIATDAVTLGLNTGLNRVAAPPDAQNDTGEKGLHRPPPAPEVMPVKGLGLQGSAESQSAANSHEDEKRALVVGGIALGLLALWLLR